MTASKRSLTGRIEAVPRHTEISDRLAIKICRAITIAVASRARYREFRILSFRGALATINLNDFMCVKISPFSRNDKIGSFSSSHRMVVQMKVTPATEKNHCYCRNLRQMCLCSTFPPALRKWMAKKIKFAGYWYLQSVRLGFKRKVMVSV